ncbi:hypothetical protein GFC30_992 [Anoxybacillus amylolyticus]|uniref:Uncharacterized protein n=1 Tax=Anoxybacteroides amylolyticum TaxID=294699 RepID=A0A167TAW8_9BACL|nr:hypothetical protein GFC30_992 [Anoxybacillus amylolyticus]
MTKRNKKTKAGLQSAKSVTDLSLSNPMDNEKSAKKSRPH